jgi:Cu2+-exporting ATPase
VGRDRKWLDALELRLLDATRAVPEASAASPSADGEPAGATAPPETDAASSERSEPAELVHVALDVQGLHCAACVWVIEELFRRHEGAVEVVVNPGAGTLDLTVRPGFHLRTYVDEVEQLGYLLGPRSMGERGAPDASSSLLLRMGIVLALAMNSMIFAFALYFGLEEEGGAIARLMHAGGYVFSALAVAIGGPVFFRGAWHAARRGVLHMDAPIALGILLAFTGASVIFFTGWFGGGHGAVAVRQSAPVATGAVEWGAVTLAAARGVARAPYTDTLTIFIALMLVGRWLQERVLEGNRRTLLADDGADGMLTRRVRDGVVQVVRCREVCAGDELLVAPGDVVPVDGCLLDAAARCALDWISGESAPRTFARGQCIPAGATNAGDRAVRVTAATDFAASSLVQLLRRPPVRDVHGSRATPWWQRTATAWVVGVVSTAAIGGVGWWVASRDLAATLDVVVAVLVVTCPCAIGIATPLAHEIVQAALRRAGLYVRTSGFLDRARDVRKVVFDKTGTLTTGALRLADPAPLMRLEGEDRVALEAMAVRSAHPKSVAVARALETDQVGRTAALAFRADLDVVEVPGLGLELLYEGRRYRLGAPGWAGHVDGAEDLVFSRDGQPLAAMRTQEELRADAAAEIARLRGEGYETYILSGDAQERVDALARALGVPPERALGGCTPEAKAAWVSANDHGDMLVIGDGLNDALALGGATCSGTPAIDRPYLPARSDFWFVTPGLAPIGEALRASRALARTVRRNLCVAVAYNAVAVGLCLGGLMTPWLAAILMPASSLAVVGATLVSLRPLRRARRV